MKLQNQTPIPVTQGVEMPNCDHRWVRELYRFTRCAKCGSTLRTNPHTGMGMVCPPTAPEAVTAREPILMTRENNHSPVLLNHEKAARLDAAFRAERDHLISTGGGIASLHLDLFIRDAAENSKVRLYDSILGFAK